MPNLYRIMNKSNPMKILVRAMAAAGIATAMICGSSSVLWSAETKPDVTDKKPAKKPEHKKLTGAELYAINCNRCHAERYPTEWNSAHWKTLMTHMRVRANLPASQAKLILKYLQEDSGN